MLSLYLTVQKNLTASRLTFCNYADNIHLEKYEENILNTYFLFQKPSSHITITQ